MRLRVIESCARRSTTADLAWPPLRDRVSSQEEALLPRMAVLRTAARRTM
jgi:hypothetical protein